MFCWFTEWFETKFCSIFVTNNLLQMFFVLWYVITSVTVTLPRNDSKLNCVYFILRNEIACFFVLRNGIARFSSSADRFGTILQYWNNIPIYFRFAKQAKYQRSTVCFVCSVFRGKIFCLIRPTQEAKKYDNVGLWVYVWAVGTFPPLCRCRDWQAQSTCIYMYVLCVGKDMGWWLARDSSYI